MQQNGDRTTEAAEPDGRLACLGECLMVALLVYWVTLLVVVAGILVSAAAVEKQPNRYQYIYVPPSGATILDTLIQWDGQHYLTIAAEGYRYDQAAGSSVAFFPAYPLLIRGLAEMTGLPVAWVGRQLRHLHSVRSASRPSARRIFLPACTVRAS